MRLCILSLAAFSAFTCLNINAQCPLSTSVWQTVEGLRASKLPENEQLKEMLELQKSCRQCRATDDSSYSNLVQRIALIYMKSRDFSNAIKYVRESISIGLVRNGKNNQRYLSKGYYILANSYKENKLYFQSISAYDSCILYADLHPDNNTIAYHSYLNIANTYFRTGDYLKAVSYADKGVLFARKLDNPFFETYCLSEKAQALSELKNQQEAALTIKKSLDIFDIEFKKNKADNNALGELANTYAIYAKILDDDHKPQLAIEYSHKAFDLFKNNANTYGCFSTLINIGYTCSEALKNYKLARNYYKKALGYASTNEDTLIYYTNMAALDFKEKKYQQTLAGLQRGLLSVPINFHDTSVRSNPSIEELKGSSNKVLILNLLRSKGDTWLDLFKTKNNKQDLAEALANYTLGDKVVDLMRYEQQLSGSKLFWRKQTHQLYENAISVCHLLNKPEKAFFFFEKSKSVLLNDELHEQNWLLKNNEELLSRQTQLKTDLLKSKRGLLDIPSNDTSYTRQAELIFTLEQELEKLQSAFKKQNPFLYFNFSDLGFFSISALQKHLLSTRQSFIEIFSGDSAVYSLIITPGKTIFSKIDKTEYQQLANRFISYISDETFLNKNFDDFKRTGNNLYKLIFAGFSVSPGRIVISPDDKSFPFEALVTSDTGSRVKYFISDYSVAYTYSAQYLLYEGAKTSKPASQGFMGVAPVRFPSSTPLPPLLESDISISKISRLFRNKDIYVEDDASRANFLEGFSNHQIIQLYTHASDSGSTGEPVIFFSDSLLYLSDLILGNTQGAKLVVLSACETGSGKLFTGEGVFSFNRGFAAMGIPSSITNLWSVDNKSSYQLTELLYKYLDQGLPTDLALQKAKLEFISTSALDKQSPFFWSAFILVGKAENLILDKPFHLPKWILYTGTLVLAFLIVFILTRFFKRRRNPRQS